MNELTIERLFDNNAEKMVTTKELAETLGVSVETIRSVSKSIIEPSKLIWRVIKGGKSLVFNEAQATAIKIELQNHSKVARAGFNTLTISNDLEASLIYKQLVEYQSNRIEQLKNEKIALENKITQDKPKINFFDTVVSSDNAKSMQEVAGFLNVGRNKLFAMLRDKGILNRYNIPYRPYIENGYFKVVETSNIDRYGNVHVTTTTLVYQKGIEYIVNKVMGCKSE